MTRKGNGIESLEVIVAMAVVAPLVAIAAPFIAVGFTVLHLICGGSRDATR